jgi:hypothetical protein
MNTPSERRIVEEAKDALNEVPAILHQLEDLIRRYPIASALTSMGVGCAIGIACHEMFTPAPPTTKRRALNLLEDIQDRLSELMEPVSEKVSEMADDGVSAVKSGLHSASTSKAVNRIRHFFS